MLEWAKAIHQAIGIESPIRFIFAIAFVGFLLFGGAAWIVDRGYRAQLRQEQAAKPPSGSTPTEPAPFAQRKESDEPKTTNLPRGNTPKQTQIGNDNTLVNVPIPKSIGSGNTFVGATDANGNTILNRGGLAVGSGAKADTSSVAIGAHAGAGNVTYEQKCEGSACAQGPGSQATFNQYGVPKPLPNIIDLSTIQMQAIPKPEEKGSRIPTMGQEDGPTWNPGLSLSFRVDAPFTNPMYLVRCDHPCVATSVLFSANGVSSFAGGMSNPSLFRTKDPNVVVFGSGFRQLLTPDITVTLTVRSQDEKPINSATVDAFAQ